MRTEHISKDYKKEALDGLKPAYKVWFETKDGYVFGSGLFKLLEKIQEVGTLSGAARSLDMSYRHAWGVLKKVEKRIGKPLLNTRKGGRFGGGGAELTLIAQKLTKEYLRIKEALNRICEGLVLGLSEERM